MRKATFIMSALSFVASVLTLGVVLGGAKKLHDDIQDVRSKTNQALGKVKQTLSDIDFSV